MLFLLPGSCTLSRAREAREAAVSWERTALTPVDDEEGLIMIPDSPLRPKWGVPGWHIHCSSNKVPRSFSPSTSASRLLSNQAIHLTTISGGSLCSTSLDNPPRLIGRPKRKRVPAQGRYKNAVSEKDP
jgi:hypothetical protein